MSQAKNGASGAVRAGLKAGAITLLAGGLLSAGHAAPGKVSDSPDRPCTRAPKQWNRPVRPFCIVSNLYYVGTAGISAYLVATPAGLILLNCGTSETAELVLENIRQLGFDPRQVKMLVGLHGHYDHVGGAAVVIKQATGAELLVGAADRTVVESGGRNDPQYGDTFAWPPAAVDRGLRDGEKIRLGGVELVVHATPGHTPGAITCTMEARQEEKQYHVVFAGSVSCPDYTLVGNARYPGIREDFPRTFKTLKSLPCDMFLTEHGWDCALTDKIKGLGQNSSPFIDPVGYRRYIETAETRYADLLRKQSEGLAGKK
jgi:metallo-beta-lactamase class B